MADTTDTDAIERDLARTRARMDDRLGKLQEKLSPGTIVNDALTRFTGGDGAEFTRDLVGRLKAHPVPALLTGIGLVWLMASGGRPAPVKRVHRDGSDTQRRLRAAEAGVLRRPDEPADAHASRLDEARGTVLGLARDASETAAAYGQRVRDGMAAAARTVRDTTHELTAAAADAAQQGHADMTNTSSRASTLAGHPLVLGAIAAVAGLVAGSLIPTSDEEEHALGGTAGRLRRAGRDLAQDVVDRGGRIASDTLDAVKNSADAHGLSASKPVGEMVADLKSGALADAVKQVAGETAEAGRQSAGKHLGHDGDEPAGPQGDR